MGPHLRVETVAVFHMGGVFTWKLTEWSFSLVIVTLSFRNYIVSLLGARIKQMLHSKIRKRIAGIS